MIERIKVIDSHTAGEPTRTIVGGFPDLGGGSVAYKRELFRSEYDFLRQAIVNEPRGHSAIVGALLCESKAPNADVGVIFFNNVGFLNMCGHGLIGVVKTLEYQGRLTNKTIAVETPVGVIEAVLNDDGSVSFENVASYRFKKDVRINVAGFGEVVGDIAWGGNWFFLYQDNRLRLELSNLKDLMNIASSIREAIEHHAIRANHGDIIDHIEICSQSETGNPRNFVLCPGFEYDRSPCGTGTSAKLACLYEDGKITEGEAWYQESIIGSVFEGSVRIDNGNVIPKITGKAHVISESELIINEDDPFRYGIGYSEKQ